MRKIFRYAVPVDGEAHTFELDGNPLHVEAQGDDVVEFWAHKYDDGKSGIRRAFQVFGTGHEVPEDARWFGTTARTPSGLVWHLFEVGRPNAEGEPKSQRHLTDEEAWAEYERQWFARPAVDPGSGR